MASKTSTADAHAFIRNLRMRFHSLYPSTLALFAQSLVSHYEADLAWVNGVIVGDSYEQEDCQLTDAGWDSVWHDHYVPTSWNDARSTAAIFNIPDDASKQWLEAISSFCYAVKKLSLDTYRDYVTAYMAMQGMTAEAQRSHIERAVSGLHSTKLIIEEKKVAERIVAIEFARSRPKGYVEPLPLVVGSTVRLRTGVDETVVLEKDITVCIGNIINKTMVRLKAPLERSNLWSANDLTVVRNPTKT